MYLIDKLDKLDKMGLIKLITQKLVNQSNL